MYGELFKILNEMDSRKQILLFRKVINCGTDLLYSFSDKSRVLSRVEIEIFKIKKTRDNFEKVNKSPF